MAFTIFTFDHYGSLKVEMRNSWSKPIPVDAELLLSVASQGGRFIDGKHKYNFHFMSRQNGALYILNG